MASIVARKVRGMKEIAYYYHRTYRVKVAPADSGKGPGSGPQPGQDRRCLPWHRRRGPGEVPQRAPA